MGVHVLRACEELLAVWAAIAQSLAAVSALVVDHVAQLGRLDMAIEALEELVGPPSSLVYHVLLHEAHVARVVSIPIAHPFLDNLLIWHLQSQFFAASC